MKFGLFLLYTTSGTLIWNTVLVYGGALLGESWGEILKFMDIYFNITYIVLALAIVTFFLYLVSKRRRET